jgi:hypothetical protein
MLAGRPWLAKMAQNLKTNMDKAAFGEACTDEYMKAMGYTKLNIGHTNPSTKGIDGVWAKDGHYVITESKFGSSGLRMTQDGRQMSHAWLSGKTSGFDRIQNAVPESVVNEIKTQLVSGKVDLVLFKIDAAGMTTPIALDALGGKVLNGTVLL